MKKLFVTLGLLATMVAPAFAVDVNGVLYQDTVQPYIGASSTASTKMGKATCTSYLGVVALGDCSVKRAMEKGNINSLSFADVHMKNIILLVVKKEIRAYGN